MAEQKEINPKMVDGKAKCNGKKCKQYEDFKQYIPACCNSGDGAGYAPINLCITWYLREVEHQNRNEVALDYRTADMLHHVLFCLMDTCTEKRGNVHEVAKIELASSNKELTDLLMREKENVRRAYRELSKAIVKTENIGVGGGR